MQSLHATIGDDDTAALVLIKVQANPDNTGCEAEVLHLIKHGANGEGVAAMVEGAAQQFAEDLVAGDLKSATSRLN